MIDSYEKFLTKYVSKEDFFDFGLSETIYISNDKTKIEWDNLKKKIYTDQEVFIRGFGRDAAGTHLFLNFYKKVFNNEHVLKDPTNNARPTKIIEELTGLKKNKDIRNYQVSHVFGRTKNIFTFTAPWNIVFTPKILDPFTGHEAKGTIVEEYQRLFKRQTYEKFKECIDEYNSIVSDKKLIQSIDEYLEELYNIDIKSYKKLQKAISEEFSFIDIPK